MISSNVTLGQERPADPGVAIWFTWDELPLCIPIDRYQTVEANLQAIHHVIEAGRTELRHGTLELVRASFLGFKALPAPGGGSARLCWDVLEISRAGATRASVESAYRAKAKATHPDAGGSHDAMAELTRAKNEALREVRVMSNEVSKPARLRCAIVSVIPGFTSPNYTYIVTDENGIVIAEGVSSSESMVRHDAGGYHTKREFDAMFPQGWHVVFDF